MKRVIFLCSVFLCTAYLGNGEASDTNTVEAPPEMQARAKQMDALINTPIDFYGKVVDQDGAPVVAAQVKIIENGAPGHAEPIVHELQSDASGAFSLKGIRAFGVDAIVTQEGYRNLPDQHPPGGWMHSLHRVTQFPTEQNPAIFVLQKKAPAEPLIVLRSLASTVQTDGTPTELSLKNKYGGKDVGILRVQVWVDPHDPKSLQPYHWKFAIAVVDGGFQFRDENQFTAPLSGYQTSDAIDALPDKEKWNDVFERRYFIQLPGGKYGRITVFINAKGGVQAEGFVNPSGSRNLEFDPAKHAE